MVTKIEILDKKKLKNPILLVGLPGIGLVGKITVDYLVQELKPSPTLYAKVVSDSFPPAVHTTKSIIELICDEIYLYSTKNQDILFLVGPVQPPIINAINSNLHYEFAKSISDFCKKLNVKKIYTFAGLNIGEKRINTKPKTIVVCTDEVTKKELQATGIKNISFYEKDDDSLISGVAGLLPGVAYYLYNIQGACLMGETDSRLQLGDHSSAKEVLDVALKLLNLKIDLGKIEKNAKKIEDSFTQIVDKLKEMDEKEAAPSHYIR